MTRRLDIHRVKMFIQCSIQRRKNRKEEELHDDLSNLVWQLFFDLLLTEALAASPAS